MNQQLAAYAVVESVQSPAIHSDVPAFMQRRNAQAISLGLPAIGTRLLTDCGMEWGVLSHIHAPNLVSYARNRGLSASNNPDDLLPRLVPEKLSKRLLDFWVETDKCTSKGFVIVDTLPHLRPQYAYSLGHTVDAWSVPDATLFAFDFATLHETIIAHEIAHVWIDLVEDCEDYRSPADWLDTGRAQQILFIQSFVLDCKVNEVIAERGFDLSIIAEHQRQTISNLTHAVLLGHRPPYVREAVTSALLIAATLLEQEKEQHDKETCSLVLCYDGSIAIALRLLRQEVPEIYDLAQSFVAAVQRHGYANREQIRRAIDECLTVAFEFSGDPLDLENDLCEVAPNETYQLDKSPELLTGWPVRAKIEVAKIRAKLRVGNNAQFRLSQDFTGATQIEFLHPCGVWTSPVMVLHAPYAPPLPSPQDALPPHLRHLPEAVRAQMMPPQPGHRAKPFSAGQIPQMPLPQVPQITPPIIAAFPELPDMPTSRLGASSKPPFGRRYMAGLGVWLSRARLQEQLDKREHPYVYAESNPVTRFDPSGRISPCGYGQYHSGGRYYPLAPGVPVTTAPEPYCLPIPYRPPGICFSYWLVEFQRQGIGSVSACIRAKAQCGSHVDCTSPVFSTPICPPKPLSPGTGVILPFPYIPLPADDCDLICHAEIGRIGPCKFLCKQIKGKTCDEIFQECGRFAYLENQRYADWCMIIYLRVCQLGKATRRPFLN